MIYREDIKIGSVVKSTNQWGYHYTVTAIVNGEYTLSHNTGEMVMKGGKLVQDIYEFPGIDFEAITEIIK